MLFDKLDEAELKYDNISAQLQRPDIMSDIATYKKLMCELSELGPVIEKYREYKACISNIAQSEELLGESGNDADIRALALEELKEAKEKSEELEKELNILLIPKDPNDEKNVIIEIRAGAGGEEAALFSYVLYRMYTMYAVKKGFDYEIMNLNETELGGFKEAVVLISGHGAYSKFKFESGVHRVQRVPETESQGRIHTSTATVAVLPEAEDVEVELNMNDVKIDTIKSTGAGGQHINKTESAIRLTHIPTGIVIECQDERSQFKNKDKAFRLLRTKLFDMKQAEQNEKISGERRNQVGTGDRSEKIRTYNYPQNRVTDHRISLTLHSLDDVLSGNLDGIVESLAANEAAEKLNNKD